MSEDSKPSTDVDRLAQFQQYGDIEALVEHGKAIGLSERELRDVTGLLTAVFEPLSLGLQPQYETIDSEELVQHEPELEFVVRAMAQSPAADMKTAGFHVMGVLDWKPFIVDLEGAVASQHDWERIEALTALGHMSHPEVYSILQAASEHPERHTRDAAAMALNVFEEARRTRP